MANNTTQKTGEILDNKTTEQSRKIWDLEGKPMYAQSSLINGTLDSNIMNKYNNTGIPVYTEHPTDATKLRQHIVIGGNTYYLDLTKV